MGSSARRWGWRPVARAAVLGAVAVAVAACGGQPSASSPGTSSGGTSLPATSGAPRHVHLRTTTSEGQPSEIRWELANADRSVVRHGPVTEGIDLQLPDDVGDWWVWIEPSEHMQGVKDDSDGLQRPGPGCAHDDCIHLRVGADGVVRLPNRADQAATSLSVTFWSVHDEPPDRSHVPDDAPTAAR